jgi:hypothetical protein
VTWEYSRTIALTATASYLAARHASPLAPAIAATHGYTVAFTISAALLGLGFILAIVLLPSKRRLDELRSAAAPAAAPPAPDTPESPGALLAAGARGFRQLAIVPLPMLIRARVQHPAFSMRRA